MAKSVDRARARWAGSVATAVLAICLSAAAAQAQEVAGSPPDTVAQEPGAAPPSSRNADTASAEANADAPVGSADVVVTGSRLISNGNNSPTPVTVVSTQQLLETQPSSVIDGLSTLPGLLGSIGTTSNVNTGGFSTLNLRGVGNLRGLILFNNRRVGPTRGAGQTDVDVIPQMLLQRVDVVTGGASAVYGSDAVSGVVNFVVDTKFNGFKASAQQGISRYGDAKKYNVSAAYGTPLGDRGHIEFGYEFRKQDGLKRADRPFFDTIYSEQGATAPASPAQTPATIGTAANPYKLYRNAVLGNVSFGGVILCPSGSSYASNCPTSPLAGLQFAQNGVLTPFNHGALTGTNNVEVGGDGAYYIGANAGAELRAHQFYARVDYDLTDDLHWYVEGTYTNFKQAVTQQSQLLSRLSIGYNNAFLNTVQPQYQAAIQAQLRANPLSSFAISKMSALLPANRPITTESFGMVAGGLSGSIGGDWKWNVDYGNTHSAEKTTNFAAYSNPRLFAALNAVVNPATGQAVCNAALVNPSVYGGCVPLNIFGPTSESQQAIAYILRPVSAVQIFDMNDVSGTVKGSPFALPAGPVQIALTGEYRRLTYRVAANGQPTDPVSCTGIQFNCTATTAPYSQSTLARPKSVQEVKEAAIEVEVPLLHDIPFIRAFTLNGAVRYTDYNTSGTVYTWKVGADWKLNDDVRVRGTRSRDIRAPNLNDLFAPVTLANQNYSDIHTGQTGLVPQRSAGNPDLQPEIANTLTAGVVVRPAFMPGFSLSVDYYRIKIDKAIFSVPAFQVATQQACELSNGISPVCSLYVRPLPFSDRSAANFPTLLLSQALNIASIKTRGVDVEANYTRPLGTGQVDARVLVNWQPKLIYDNGPGGVFNIAGAADGVGGLPPIAKVKVVGHIGYSIGDVRIRVQERWRAAIRQNATQGLFFVDGDIPAVGYTDLNLNFDVMKQASLFFNVQNLFDKKPFPYASVGGSVQMNYLGGYAQGDDIEGAYYTVGLRVRL